jgi:hypothetical protein
MLEFGIESIFVAESVEIKTVGLKEELALENSSTLSSNWDPTAISRRSGAM